MLLNGMQSMEEIEKRLRVYCETTFWSYLNGGRTPLSHIAVKQAFTRQWWQDIAPSCEIYVSQYVEDESSDGNAEFADRRLESMANSTWLDGTLPDVLSLADLLMRNHAVPEDEATDASHIATAAVYGMDVLLTWNCRHIANSTTLPTTIHVLTSPGYRSPIITTPYQRLEELDV